VIPMTRKRNSPPTPGVVRPTIRLAGILLLAAMPLACDLDWKEEASRAYVAARKHAQEGRFDSACTLYKRALKLNPFHPDANFRLAELYETRLFGEPQAEQWAVYYYRRQLDLRGADRQRAEFMLQQIPLLERIDAGGLEDPADAVRDLLEAAAANSLRAFSERLHQSFISALIDQYKSLKAVEKRLEFWNGLAKPGWSLVYRDIRKLQNEYRAMVIIRLADGQRRKLGFRLAQTGIWELGADEADTDS